jgi:hypothetical protein
MLTGAILMILFTPSCMKDKPESLPANLEWNPQVALPLGEDAYGMNGESGFDTSLLEQDSISGLPLWVGLHEVVMEGEFDFDLSSISENLDNLNAVLFRVNCSNQFPQTMFSQGYFRDQDGTYIDSMFLDGPVETPAARVREAGTSIDPGLARHDALIEAGRIPALASAQSILFRSSFIVARVDSSLIPVYPGFLFQIDSGVMLDLSYEN